MKRLLAIILALVLVFGLAACGKSKLPEGFDQTLYDYAVAAYELVRDYNLGKIDKDSAKERAETIARNVKSLSVPENNSTLTDGTFKLAYETYQLSIRTYMNSFSSAITSGRSTTDIESNLKGLLE